MVEEYHSLLAHVAVAQLNERRARALLEMKAHEQRRAIAAKKSEHAQRLKGRVLEAHKHKMVSAARKHAHAHRENILKLAKTEFGKTAREIERSPARFLRQVEKIAGEDWEKLGEIGGSAKNQRKKAA